MAPPRLAQVDHNLLRGGIPGAEDVEHLAGSGIRRVVSLDGPIGKWLTPKVTAQGQNHLVLPIDRADSDVADHLPSLIHRLADTPTYVHCRHGKDRTGLFCALYRVLRNGWDIGDALDEAAEFGMGTGMPLKDGQRYFERVAELTDSNNAEESIVEKQRTHLARDQHQPAIDDPSKATPMQQSWSPYTAYDEIRPEDSATSISFPMMEGWPAEQLLFKYTTPAKAMSNNQVWFFSPEEAINRARGNPKGSRMYSSRLTQKAKVGMHGSDVSSILVDLAGLNSLDAMCFFPPTESPECLVIDADALSDVSGDDQNDAGIPLEVGLHDNYTGLAPNIYPGSQGFVDVPTGGFAGFMTMPLSIGG